jgi:hypothetical protein
MRLSYAPLGVAGALSLIFSAGLRSANAATPAPAAALHRCVADPNGKIDFQGHLGAAGGPSIVRIFSSSEASDFYLNGFQSVLGTGAQPTAPVTTVAEAEKLLRLARKVPAMLAGAYVAPIGNGNFSCLGFAPGRYSFLAEVHGNGARAGDPPLGITYYRADVDVSSLTRRAIVVVQGFRRIGTYPPQSN